MKYDSDIGTLISHIEELSTLHNAITAAGLADTLKGADAVTLFAPDNEAFAKLPGGTILSGLEDADKLKTVLTYHVVPQKLVASNLRKEKSVTTMQGGTLKIEEHRWLRSGIKVNGAVVKLIILSRLPITLLLAKTQLLPPRVGI